VNSPCPSPQPTSENVPHESPAERGSCSAVEQLDLKEPLQALGARPAPANGGCSQGGRRPMLVRFGAAQQVRRRQPFGQADNMPVRVVRPGTDGAP
jgi:hypothetical protein